MPTVFERSARDPKATNDGPATWVISWKNLRRPPRSAQVTPYRAARGRASAAVSALAGDGRCRASQLASGLPGTPYTQAARLTCPTSAASGDAGGARSECWRAYARPRGPRATPSGFRPGVCRPGSRSTSARAPPSRPTRLQCYLASFCRLRVPRLRPSQHGRTRDGGGGRTAFG